MAFAALRHRLVQLTERLQPAHWRLASRCELWSVHDVLRHVRDACRLHVRQLHSEGASVLEPGFDARLTPQRWLEQTTGESPEATARDLRTLAAEEAAGLAARTAAPRDEAVMGPYGPVHWTVLTTHVFWDAWVHARDVTEMLGWEDESTAVEEEVAVTYALLIASMPAALNGHAFRATLDLTGGDGRSHHAMVEPARVSLHSGDRAQGGAQLCGRVGPVVDALAGRGPELPAVLDGDAAAREPLTWLRPILKGGN